MPDIFTKNQKIKIVEYGGSYSLENSWTQFKQDFLAYCKSVFRI